MHYRHQGQLHAYAAYAREIDVWADLFPDVVIASPCRDEPPPGDCCAFSRSNISVSPVREAGGRSLLAKLLQVLMLPLLIWDLSQAMWRADAIHVRCPGNLGLLGVILAPLFSRRLIAKYAGQWTGYDGEAATYRFQRRLLGSSWWRGPVTVYGEWPNQPPNVVPFFTSIMGPEEMQQARAAAANRQPGGRSCRGHFLPAGSSSKSPLRLLYVGRLSKEKNVHALIESVAELRQRDVDVHCEIVGIGPYREHLQTQATQLGVAERIDFVGGVEFAQVFDHYAKADVLVLVSTSEGWPKAIAEAMACGLICIGSDLGLVPSMLSAGRGFVVPPGDVAELVKKIELLAGDDDLRLEMSAKAATWGQRYSLEDLRDELADLMSSRWGVSLAAVSETGSLRAASEAVTT